MFNLGERVRCTGYIKKSGNLFIKGDGDIYAEVGEFVMVKDKEYTTLQIPLDDEYTVDRYRLVEADFGGVYVGKTKRSTTLTLADKDDGWSEMLTGVYMGNPKEFGIVYYRKNGRRLVPLDMIFKEK